MDLPYEIANRQLQPFMNLFNTAPIIGFNPHNSWWEQPVYGVPQNTMGNIYDPISKKNFWLPNLNF
jgi:hypothetical protein